MLRWQPVCAVYDRRGQASMICIHSCFIVVWTGRRVYHVQSFKLPFTAQRLSQTLLVFHMRSARRGWSDYRYLQYVQHACINMDVVQVDYIWYTPNSVSHDPDRKSEAPSGSSSPSVPPSPRRMLRVVRTLDSPDSTQFHQVMPNAKWPSDHISLVADFVLCTRT